MTASSREPLRVVAAVIRKGGLVLACRRAQGRASAGKWEFPGGKVEIGETDEDALIREIGEELNVQIEVTSHLSTDETLVGDRMIRLACYFARMVVDGPVTSIDHDSMIWVDVDQLTTLDWAGPDWPAVRRLGLS